jgi:hypothetical protein
MKLGRRENTGQGERVYYTGFFPGTPRLINPTAAELAEAIGYEQKEGSKEIEYEGKTREGEDFVSIHVWMQAPEGQWFPAKFMFINKEVTDTDEKTGQIKTQWVNQTGNKKKIDSESNLLNTFTKFLNKDKQPIADKIYRRAIQGEAKWYGFLQCWLNHVDPWSVDTNLLIDVKKMFRNIDKYVKDEYQPHIVNQHTLDKMVEDEKSRPEIEAYKKEIWTEPVLAHATVSIGDKDGQPVFYQQVFREFLPHYCIKNVQTAIASNSWKDKKLEYVVEQLTGQYNKDQYSLSLLQKFDPENPATAPLNATNETMRVAADDKVDDMDY